MPAVRTMAQREARLAIAMLTPAFMIVFSIILFPVLLNFWISFKPVQLADLRPPTPMVREQVAQVAERAGEEFHLVYRLRNSSPQRAIAGVTLRAYIPSGLTPLELPPDFAVQGNQLSARLGAWEPGYNASVTLRFRADSEFVAGPYARSSVVTAPTASGRAPNRLFDATFTLRNYRVVLSARDLWPSLWTTVVYTTGGAIGAVLLGLGAALLMDKARIAKGLTRGLLLFPYVAPVIAVAFAWAFFLDPFSGTVNAVLVRLGVIETPISFLSERHLAVNLFGLGVRLPLALTSVIAFDAWRYFPFVFLFVLARLQAIPASLYESADVDGATPYQKFFSITLPQLSGVLATLFLLRFMWTFNKFDDVFLLTGGAGGTKTLPIQVYDNAFGRADIGAGAATAVVLFAVLAFFLGIYFKTVKEDEQS